MSARASPRLLTRRLAALAGDLLIAGLIVIVLIAATPLGRMAALPLPPGLLGPTTCTPVTAETFADHADTRLWIDIWQAGQRDPGESRFSQETSLCHAQIFGLLPYAHFKLTHLTLLDLDPLPLWVEILPVDASGTVYHPADHTLALVACLMLLAALQPYGSLGKRLLGLRVTGPHRFRREALRLGPFLLYGLLCALDPLVVAGLRPDAPPSENPALIEAWLDTHWFLGTPWQSAVDWSLFAYALLGLSLIAVRRLAPWDRLAQTTVTRQ
ncbi:hypothetical protein [Pararhodobacter zhoushanensis]|uniref:RDD family protein n=1 Tax=Pararhodobacter zhoushanensis TaxID=2479545 RepID=A0ABT3H1B6_9RHOB|nr:hypothetical protein [Pararhodobacter zhoushanensis]MCW1933608.1 hypothetical protein [Pararhodobacter zhoushanensis]